MPSISHMEETILEHADQPLGLLVRVVLMGLHRQEKDVPLLGPGVFGYLTDGLSEQVDRLFAVGKNK